MGVWAAIGKGRRRGCLTQRRCSAAHACTRTPLFYPYILHSKDLCTLLLKPKH